MQSDSHLDKSPSTQKHSSATPSSLQQYPVRRMRNTAVLVKWIEEHQSNPYPTKAEKQYLAYYSGMNLTQLSTWFANARRRIKKIGMKTWLEGRSTFTVDFFPSRNMTADYLNGSGAYNSSLSSASPYTMQYSATLQGSYPTNQTHLGLGPSHRLAGNFYNTAEVPSSSSSTSLNYGLYATTSRPPIGLSALANWSSTQGLLPGSSTPLASSMQARPSSNTGPTLHSPLTAQVYTDPNALRPQAPLDPYSSLARQSPDHQMLPECASTEPMLQGTSPKTRYTVQAD